MSQPLAPQSFAPQPLAHRHGRHFTAIEVGPQASLPNHHFTLPDGRDLPGKLFLREWLGASGVELSWSSLPVGTGLPFLHAHHEHEEIYLFTGGEGEFQVDGEIFAVAEGSVVRVAPDGRRGLRNTGAVPLTHLVLQVRPGTVLGGPIDDGYRLPEPPSWE